MITEEELERRRFYLATHKRIPEEYRYFSSELDRVYGAVTAAASWVEKGEVDDSDQREVVVCPICGWTSKPFYASLAWTRQRYFAEIAKRLMNHIRRKHPEICERVSKGYVIGGAYIEPSAERATYRCKICGQEEKGVIEILAHYLAFHTTTLADYEKAEDDSPPYVEPGTWIPETDE